MDRPASTIDSLIRLSDHSFIRPKTLVDRLLLRHRRTDQRTPAIADGRSPEESLFVNQAERIPGYFIMDLDENPI
jgi:hypothetical protein